MSSSNSLKVRIADNGWACPPLASIRDQHPLGVATHSAEDYFRARRQERTWLAESVLQLHSGQKFSLCSIGCGYGGEESLLAETAGPLVLIEPDDRQSQFLRETFPPSVRIEKSYFQFCRFEQPFDVIYAASLGSWMNSDPMAGMDGELLGFLKSYLKPGGLGVFLLYGGNHSPFILDKAAYAHRLMTTAHEAGFQVLLYGKYQPRAALLVMSTSNRDVAPFEKNLLADQIYVRGNRLVKSVRAPWRAYPATLIVAANAVIKNLAKTWGDFAASFRLVKRLRRPD